jgi:hypothetical protein
MAAAGWEETVLDLIFLLVLAFVVHQSKLSKILIIKEIPAIAYFSCAFFSYSIMAFLFIGSPLWGAVFLAASISVFIFLKAVMRRKGKRIGFNVFSLINFAVFLIALFSFPNLGHLSYDDMDREKWDRAGLERPGVNWLAKSLPMEDGFQAIYPMGETELVKRFDPYMIHVIENDAVLISYERRKRIDKINLKTHSLQYFFREGGRRPFFFLSPDNKKLYTGSFYDSPPNRKMFEVRVEDMSMQREIPFGNALNGEKSPVFNGFRIGSAIGEQKYVCTFQGDIFTLGEGNKVENSFTSASWGIYNHFSFSQELNRIYAPSFPWRLYSISMRPLELKAERFLLLGMWTVPIVKQNEVATNGAFSVLILDSETLETKRKIYTGFGIRCLDYDPMRNWIYVAKYFSGELEVYDLGSGEKIGELEVGPLLRCVCYSPATDRIYTGSSTGVLEISPEIFSK